MKKLIICEICKEECERIYGAHLKKHGMTSSEYKKLFPNAKLMSESDLSNTIKNSGKHMKSEKYKKMFSEMITGEKNPNHKSRSTEEERKSRSPFSKKFINYSGTEEEIKESVSIFTKNAIKDRLTTVNLQYWIKKGYSEEDAKLILKERQSAFTLKKCIGKHGEIDGKKRWMERQNKWLTNYKKVNYSSISQDLFISLYNRMKDLDINEEVFFAKLDRDGNIHNTNKNYEYRLNLKDRYILPDFFIPRLSLIIEFDGVYYHRNTPENTERERLRNESIFNCGYDVIHISEIDYKKDRDGTIDNIINLINQKQLKNA